MTQNSFVKNAVSSFNQRRVMCKSKLDNEIFLVKIGFSFLIFLSMMCVFIIWPEYIKHGLNQGILPRITSFLCIFVVILLLKVVFDGMGLYKILSSQFSQSFLDYIKQEIAEYMSDRNNWVGQNCENFISSFFLEDLYSFNKKEQEELLKWLKQEWPDYATQK